MGGSETVDWARGLDASFEAALAREEEVAAADLAFSLRQDVDLRATIDRSGVAWMLVRADGALLPVDEVGVDYVRAGAFLVRSAAVTLRSVPGPSPRSTDVAFLEVLGAVCRSGARVAVGGAHGRLVRVAKDHVALVKGGSETIVGFEAVEAVRIEETGGYSASRGFSG